MLMVAMLQTVAFQHPTRRSHHDELYARSSSDHLLLGPEKDSRCVSGCRPFLVPLLCILEIFIVWSSQKYFSAAFGLFSKSDWKSRLHLVGVDLFLRVVVKYYATCCDVKTKIKENNFRPPFHSFSLAATGSTGIFLGLAVSLIFVYMRVTQRRRCKRKQGVVFVPPTQKF